MSTRPQPTDAYLCDLGAATYWFQSLEWQIRQLVALFRVDELRPGTRFPNGLTRHVMDDPDPNHQLLVEQISKISGFTSGQLAADLATRTPRLSDPGLSTDFADLVRERRNPLMHSNPARALSERQGAVLRRWHGDPFEGGDFAFFGRSWLAVYIDLSRELEERARREVEVFTT